MPLICWTGSDTNSVHKLLQPLKASLPGGLPAVVAVTQTLLTPGEGEVIMAMGTKAVAVLQEHKIVPKGRTVKFLREKPIPYQGGWWLVANDPYAVNSDPAVAELIQWDAQLACRLLTAGHIEPQIGQYDWVEDLSGVRAYVEYQHQITGRPVPVTLDLETMGLYPYYQDKKIVTVQVSPAEGHSDVVYTLGMPQSKLDVLISDLRWLLNTPMVKLRGANLKFDLVWLYVKWGLTCSNFSMDTTIVGSILNENRSNSLNHHAKLYTAMGGYDDCVAPDTRVLTADLEWVPVGGVQAGDALVGFDEKGGIGKGQRRRLRTAVAESTKRLKKEGVRITFEDGRYVECSSDHGFLAITGANGGGVVWRRASQLKSGSKVKLGAPVEQPDPSYDAGWLAGFLDGEGYLSHSGPGMCLGWSQKDGPVWDRAVELTRSYGIDCYVREKGSSAVLTSKMSAWPALRVLQLVRPQRLLAKRGYENLTLPTGHAVVGKIEPLGEIEVVSLQTSTHTFIAEGLCSHNSFNAKYDKGQMEKIPKADLLTYAGGDTDACLRASNVMISELSADRELQRFYVKVLHPAARGFEKIEARGIPVNRDKMMELRTELVAKIQELEGAALQMMPRRLRLKHVSNLSLSKPSLLKDFFFTPLGLNLKPKVTTEKSGEPSTAKDHLLMFNDVPEAKAFVEIFEQWSVATKTLSTYVDGFLAHLRPDGRFHPSYFLFAGQEMGDLNGGTSTGRLSAKSPAMQCMVGETLVKTDQGIRRLDWLVEHAGAGLKVLTHLGVWRDIVGVYRNGVQPVFTVTSKSGNSIVCTGNHPVLTSRGWVRTDELEAGDACFRDRAWAPNSRVHQPHVLLVGSHEEPLPVPHFQGLEELRGPGNTGLRPVAGLRQVPGRHGGEAWERVVDRTPGQSRGLHPRKLRVGAACGAAAQPPKYQLDNASGGDQDRGGVGSGIWDFQGKASLPEDGTGSVYGRGPEEGRPPEEIFFAKDVIVSVTPCGFRETFDLTIDRSHSFVANGLVVHNTLPKHTAWAKKLRLCYEALPGYVMWEIDFDQGELKITADVSCDTNMLEAYLLGQDLHMKTGGTLAGYDYEEMEALKAMGDPDQGGDPNCAEYKLFKSIRQKAKAANFGLIYRISVAGYMEFARKTYKVVLTLEEAEQHFKQFFGLYDKLLPWHDEYVGRARKYGWVRSPMGRVRHLPLIHAKDSYTRGVSERQAINCLSDDTEMLTPGGWKTVDQLTEGEPVFSVNPISGEIETHALQALTSGVISGPMLQIDHASVSALATPNHRWLIDRRGNSKTTTEFRTSETLAMTGDHKLWIATEGLKGASTTWTDDEVRLLGWVLTDGHYIKQKSKKTGKEWGCRVGVTQSKGSTVQQIAALFGRLGKHGHHVSSVGQHVWSLAHPAAVRIRGMMPDKTLTAEVLMSMSSDQHQILYETMLLGDGCWDAQAGRHRKFVAGTKDRADAFLMLCALIGQPARASIRDMTGYTPKLSEKMKNVQKMGTVWLVELVKNKRAQPQYGSKWVEWSGRVWCPTVEHGAWIAKRNGKVFVTGNSPIQGCLSDMGLYAIGILSEQYPDLWIAGMTHDALYGFCREDEVDKWVPRISGTMSNLPLYELGWEPKLQFTASAEVGKTWATMVPMAV